MKDTKWIIITFVSVVCIYAYFAFYTEIFDHYNYLSYIMFGLIIILSIFIIKELFIPNTMHTGSKDKLLKSLLQNTDTVYIMINSKNNNVVYMSDNVEEVLGIKTNDKNSEDVVYKILNIPIIKSELNNWDKISNYVSGMIEYDNPSYNHKMWIRVKVSPYENYYIIQIMDATKDHDRQHLLISQATNIKSRESVLNQITEKSYDFEIYINLVLNTYELKYFKKDKLYFGEETRGKYTDGLKNILKFVNDSDKELVEKNLNLESLKDHFERYELDSNTIRYRIGNELKNNIWLESTIFFINDRQKNMVTILTKNVTEDAESIRQQNVMLQNALNDSKLVSKSKTDLISTISHDIRIPLTNIVGLSDALLDKKLDKDIEDDIKNINDSSNDMLEIIDGLLDTSKIEKRLIEKDERNYSIFKLFKNVERSAKEYIGNKQIKLNTNLDSNLPVVLFGDDKRIIRAINEIVNNSIKHTSEGKIDINVKGEKIEDKVNLIIEINDTGDGIEEDKLKKIMSSDDVQGIGSVKNLMKLLDGKLEIESNPGEYTNVTVSFMQKIVEDNKVREMMSKNKKAEEFSLKGKKVLIVDDNELNLKVTSRLLEPYNLDITLITSGEECIELIKSQNNFDLILMDQMMPGLSGTDVMKKLKDIEGFKTPIVVLTADAMEGQKEKYLSEGFDDYISKPIDKVELSRVLKKFIKDN